MAEMQTRELKLPMLVELRGPDNLSESEAAALLKYLRNELAERRRKYPFSPLVMLPGGNSAFSKLVAQLAAESGIEIAGRHALPVGTCHVAVDVSRRDAVGTDPPGTSIDLDPERFTETVRLVFDGADAELRPEAQPGPPADLATAEDEARKICRRTDSFNRAASSIASKYPDSIATSAMHLAPEEISATNQRTASLRDVFAVADTLALYYQQRLRLAFGLIFTIGAIAYVCYSAAISFHDVLLNLDELAFAPWLLMLLVAYTIYYVAKKGDIHDNYVDCRALAEGIRVQFFWAACGAKDNAADHYLRRHAGDLGWVRQALRSLEAKSGVASDERVARAEALAFWIQDQEAYFSKTLVKAKRLVKRTQWVARAIFLAGVAGMIVHLFKAKLGIGKDADEFFFFLSLVAPAVAAAIYGFVNKMGYQYQAKHYARMLAIYRRAEDQLRASACSSQVLAVALGIEALHENGEWALFRKERGIDEPSSAFKKPW